MTNFIRIFNFTETNECDIIDICADNSACTNTPGSYQCQCLPGYRGDGYENCTNIDECKENPDICDARATCTDTEGSYVCQCVVGYTGNGTVCQSKYYFGVKTFFFKYVSPLSSY